MVWSVCLLGWHSAQPSLPPSDLPTRSSTALVGDWGHSARQLPPTEVLRQARSITVRVLAGQGSGSGILVQRQGNLYSLITNHHVLTPGAPYRVQAPDGKVYPATVLSGRSFARQDRFLGNDLEILQFRSPQSYPIATLNPTSLPVVGSEVYAAGFPAEAEAADRAGFALTQGQVALLLERSLSGGYRIGSTNHLHKGMSGGPLLNPAGEVVGVNGLHAYPLWGDPYIFQDGSLPLPGLRQTIVRSSWAIPIATVICLAPLRQMTLAPSVRQPYLCARQPNGIAPA